MCVYISILFFFKQIEIQQFAVPTESQQISTAKNLSHNDTRDELKNYLTGKINLDNVRLLKEFVKIPLTTLQDSFLKSQILKPFLILIFMSVEYQT